VHIDCNFVTADSWAGDAMHDRMTLTRDYELRRKQMKKGQQVCIAGPR
jgi:hypothetical protein